VDGIVRTCLAKNPDDRFQTAREVKLALEWSSSDSIEIRAVTTREARSWPRIVAAAAAMAALAIAGGWAVSNVRHTPPPEERAVRLSLNPPEGGQFVLGNTVGGIALSPDGRTAAFVAARDGISLLWVMDLDGSPATPLRGTDGAAYPFWSPDNRSLAFFSRGRLWRVERKGGDPALICSVAVGRGGAWMSGHRILFGSLAAGLFLVPDSSGTPSALTTPDTSRGETSHRWPQVLPDGRFLYWVQSGRADIQGVYAASLASPAEAKRLVPTDANALYAPGGDGRGYLLWLRGGTLVAQELDPVTLTLTGEQVHVADPVTRVGTTSQMNVAVSAGGLLLYSSVNARRQFTWIDRAAPGRKPLDVVGEPDEYGAFRLSPDQTRIAAMRDRPGGSDIWLLAVKRGVPSKFTSDSSTWMYPVWSPDNRSIVFTLTPTRNLHRKDSGGAGAEQRLSQSPNSQYAVDWSGDGRWVLYWEIAPDTGRDLWVQPMAPGGGVAADARPRRFLGTPASESWGRFSPGPDPRWVAYQSDETDRFEVYIDAFSPSQPRGKLQISTAGGSYPQWGPEGRELFYVSPEFQLMVVDLKATANGLEPAAPRKLFRLPAVDLGYSPYDVTPDGRRFLVLATPEHGASQPLTVIVNWPALMNNAGR
jgi:Tol biopolymer transport system component